MNVIDVKLSVRLMRVNTLKLN